MSKLSLWSIEDEVRAFHFNVASFRNITITDSKEDKDDEWICTVFC